MTAQINESTIAGWSFAAWLITLGILNLVLVHPVPGLFYLLFSLLYLPPVVLYLKQRTGFYVPAFIKIILGYAVLWATLGVSDLAEIMGL